MGIVRKLFPKAIFGYSKEQVEAYYDQSKAQLAELERIQLEYRSKCEEMERQLEEYRLQEKELAFALITASIAANNLMHDAESKAKNLLEETNRIIQQKIADSDEKLHQKSLALQAMEAEISNYREMCRRHASQLLDVLEQSKEEDSGRKFFGGNVVSFLEDKKQAK